MTYFIATYGCQMNVHESEKIAGVLESMGYALAEDIQKADIVVFNTCAIRESAEQKILGNIGALKPIKAKRKDMLLVVCGCMSQQEAMAGVLKEKYPFVDIVLGTHNLADLRKFIEQKIAQKKRKNKYISPFSIAYTFKLLFHNSYSFLNTTACRVTAAGQSNLYIYSGHFTSVMSG